MQRDQRTRSGERGQALIEYTFILILVALVVLAVLLIFRSPARQCVQHDYAWPVDAALST